MGKTIFKIISISATALFSCFNVGLLIYDEIPKINNETIRLMLTFLLLVIGLFFIGAAIYNIVSTVLNRRKKHKLKLNSNKFYNFFAKWYQKEGHLHIICDDLNWINSDIMTVLMNKKNKLTLFVAKGNRTDKSVLELENNGAIIKEVSKDIVEKFSFSYVDYMGNAFHIIFRDKSLDTNRYVKFEELNLNTALIPFIKKSLE